jgi:hypothetical protein
LGRVDHHRPAFLLATQDKENGAYGRRGRRLLAWLWRSVGHVEISPSACTARKRIMSFVTEEDFETDVFEAGVNVFFKPTKSHYSFFRLGPDNQVVRFAPLSRDATIRHTGPTGDIAGYDPEQVLDMAYQAALKADKHR